MRTAAPWTEQGTSHGHPCHLADRRRTDRRPFLLGAAEAGGLRLPPDRRRPRPDAELRRGDDGRHRGAAAAHRGARRYRAAHDPLTPAAAVAIAIGDPG